MTLQYKRIAGVEEKLQGHQFGLDIAFADDLLVNESEMSLWVPFASGVRRDGVGDLLEIGGIDTSRHIKNPVVLFDHGKAVQLPVGMSEDPDTKQYRVVLDPVAKVAKGKAYFYQGSKDMEGVGAGQVYEHALFCEQLFDLVVKRFIRAGSIGYQVKTARRLPADFNTGTPEGLHLISVLMLEFSVVVMPANADTVGKVLSLDKICGKRLSPYLVKSLAPYAPPRKAMMGYEGKARTPNRYRGDPPTLPGEGYNDSRNIGVGASTANPNSVAGAETIVNLQHHTNQINDAERSRRMAEIQRQHHGLDEEEAEEKNLPRQGRKANKRPTYRDVGAVPRVSHGGPADEQADLDQPFDTPADLYSRSNYLPSTPDDPNTLAGHFALTQEDGHDHMIARAEANDLASGHRQDIDIGEQGPYVPRPHPRDRKRKSIDKLSGGLADNKQPQDFDLAQLKAGIKVEMEHTDDPRMAREIAMDHLSEDPAYYQKLSRMEGKRLPRQGQKTAKDRLYAYRRANGEVYGVGAPLRHDKVQADEFTTGMTDTLNTQYPGQGYHVTGTEPATELVDDGKRLPRQGRKANRNPALRRDFDDTDLVNELDQEQPGYAANAEMVRSENANYIHGPRIERNRQRAIERADAANARELEKEGKANLDPRQRQFVDQLNQYTGQELPDEEYHEVPPQNVNLTPRQQIFMDNLERMRTGTPRRSVKALRKLYGNIKSQPSDDIPKEKARQILKDGEVQGHPLTEKQRRMFGAAAGKSSETPVRNPAPITENSQRERLDNLAYRLNEYARNEGRPELYQPVSSGVHTSLNIPHYPSKSSFDNKNMLGRPEEPRKDRELRMLEGRMRQMDATLGPVGEEEDAPHTHSYGRLLSAHADRLNEINDQHREEEPQTVRRIADEHWPSVRNRNLGDDQKTIDQFKSLRIKSLRKMYGTKMAKRNGESNEEYAARMNQEEIENANRQYDQRINDYYHAAVGQSPHEHHPEITQHFDGEVQRGSRDMARAGDAADRNYERRLQGGKAYQEAQYSEEDESGNRELIQNGMDPAINDPKTTTGSQSKRDRERYGPHTNYDYRPEREPGTANMPDYEGQEFGARNQFAFENQPSREEQQNEYQARRERYYEENKALPGERLPVPHGAEIHRNTIPPAHRDFRVISSKSAEGEDDLPDFYKPKEPVHPPAAVEPRRYYREHRSDGTPIRAASVYDNYHNFGYQETPVRHTGKDVIDTIQSNTEDNGITDRHFREVPGSDVYPHEIHQNILTDQEIEDLREQNEASGHLPKRRTPKTKGMKVRNWDEYEQHQERLDNESLQAQRDPNVTDEQNAAIQDRVGREYERLQGYSDKINRRQRRIDQRRQQEEKGLDLFSGATHGKIGKYTDQAFHSFETGQISEDQLRERLAKAARVRAEMDKARGQFMRQKDDRLDHYNQQAVAGKSAEDLAPRSREDRIAALTRVNRAVPRRGGVPHTPEQAEQQAVAREQQADEMGLSDVERDRYVTLLQNRANRYRGHRQSGMSHEEAMQHRTDRFELPQGKGIESVEGDDDLPDFYKPKERERPQPTPEQAHQQAYRDIENARRAINREMLDDNISTGFNSRADQRLQRRNILRAAHNARIGGNLSGVYEHLGRLPSKEETLRPPEKSLKSRIKSLRKMYGRKAYEMDEEARRGAINDLKHEHRKINSAMNHDTTDAIEDRLRMEARNKWREEKAKKVGRLGGTYGDMYDAAKPDDKSMTVKSLRKMYGSKARPTSFGPDRQKQTDELMTNPNLTDDERTQGVRNIIESSAPLHNAVMSFSNFEEIHSDQNDDKSMGNDQEEVANKPLKDGVLPGLKRNKRSINGDALLYVDEKDIPDVRKKAEELGLKIHRITGNTPGYVRMRLQGNDNDIDTVASVFGKLADTKE